MRPWIKFILKAIFALGVVSLLYNFGGEHVREALDLGFHHIKLVIHDILSFIGRIIYKFS